MECYVDEEGRYTRDVGPRLYRKSVLEDGSSLVQQMFKQSVLLVEKVPMSISVDWRTKLPTIVRTSQQWFINIAAIRGHSLILHTCADIRSIFACVTKFGDWQTICRRGIGFADETCDDYGRGS